MSVVVLQDILTPPYIHKIHIKRPSEELILRYSHLQSKSHLHVFQSLFHVSSLHVVNFFYSFHPVEDRQTFTALCLFLVIICLLLANHMCNKHLVLFIHSNFYIPTGQKF